MARRNRIIIDTDPGVDDTLAMLMAFASSPEELEVLMLSVSYGNIPVKSALKNVVSLFHVIEKEIKWRRENGLPEGFEALKNCAPLVAVGPDHALEKEILAEDGFHGHDGLHGVHDIHPHLTPADTWASLFEDTGGDIKSESFHSYFTPSKQPAHLEILRILREEPEGTISICVVGPMTNIALAAAHDPKTFLRVKELVVMGGAVDCPGNITPVAEFNTFADTTATARVFALTSRDPASTMPVAPQRMANLQPYPKALPKQLSIKLFPLDLTVPHVLRKDVFTQFITPFVGSGSPLAIWVKTFLDGTFNQIERMSGNNSINPGLQLHDPVTIWYIVSRDDPGWMISPNGPEDIRVETSGQWTHGMMVRDRRGFPIVADASSGEISGDDLGWRSVERGNRIDRYVSSPGRDKFGQLLLNKIFRGV